MVLDKRVEIEKFLIELILNVKPKFYHLIGIPERTIHSIKLKSKKILLEKLLEKEELKQIKFLLNSLSEEEKIKSRRKYQARRKQLGFFH